MTHQLNRRDFLKSSAAAAAMAGWYVNPGVLQASTSPNEKLNIACIGTQNRASGNIDPVGGSENMVAFCDVDLNYLNSRLQGYPKAKGYRDFREMLEKEEKNIDAVVVSTADHTHAPATAMALRMKKHAYCEKPLTHTVSEARTVAKLAKENNLVTQMGTQIHAGDNYRRVVELVESGAIGPVTEVHTWCGKGWSNGRYAEPSPVPAHLDWDLWLGPAPEHAYSANIHPANWRRFWNYGTGTLGDMGCHIMDLVHWALDLKYPVRVSAEGPEVHPVGCPEWVIVHLDYPSRGDRPAVKSHWYDGGKYPSLLQDIKNSGGPDLTRWGIGVVFVGEKGMLAADYGQRVLLPKDKFEGFTAPEQYIPNSIGHHQEWLQAIKTGGKTTCNFEYSGALTEAVLLGTVAYRTGKELEWDAEKLKATNCPEADQYVNKEYRKGWSV